MYYYKMLILLTFFFLTCSKAPAPQLSLKEILLKHKFNEGSGMYNLEIKFFENGNYESSYSTEGEGWEDKGTYTIKDNLILLKPLKCNSNESCKYTFGQAECHISDKENSYSHKKYLVCNSKNNIHDLYPRFRNNKISFRISSFPYLPSEEVFFQNKYYIATGIKSGRINDNAKIRKEPSINGQALKYVVNEYDGPFYDYLPKGTNVTIMLRTKEKEKVKNWENYWYLITAGDSDGWVFGEFIDLL